jgi:magnesium transporter
MDFDDQQIDEVPDASLERCDASLESEDTTTWLHVQGAPSAQILEALSRSFGHHTLALEDILNLGQRPKVEDYDEELFVVMNYPVLDKDGDVQLEQVSLFLGSGYVVSFHEGAEDIFEPVRQRLRSGRSSRIRTRGADYLLYTLLDLIVDSGFPALEHISSRLEELEEQALAEPSRELQSQLHQIRRTLIALRRGLGPQRDVLNALIRDEHPLVHERNRVYLRDCHDHALRILDTLDTLRELVLSNQEIYMSSLSNRMNDIMKVLTMIATIFIPLSFFTGLYGMNFNRDTSPWNMPELDSYYGYPLLLLFLVVVAGLMLWFFKRKDWF